MEQKSGQELMNENIKILIDNHLIARHKPADSALKEHYIVITENLIDFIGQNFAWKKAGLEKVFKIKNK